MPCVPKGDNLKSYPFFIWKIQNKFVYLIYEKAKNSINSVIGSDNITIFSKTKVSY